MKRFLILQRVCAVGVLVLATSAYAQPQHDDGHEHEPTAQAPQQAQPADGIINTTCPVTTDEEVDPAFTIEYKGQTIGFCCRKCRTRFDQDPEAYLAELPMLQTVSTTTQEPAHNDGLGEAQAHEHDEGIADDHNESIGEHSDDGDGDHDEGKEHDHATGHGQEKSGLAKLISWLGKFHPPTTHIPIGMLIGGAMAEGLYILTKRDLFRNACTFCVVFAGFGAIGAVTLGWFNGGFALVDDQWVQTVHRWLGTSTALLTLLSVALLIRTNKPGASDSSRFKFRLALFASAGLVGATGFFGGALVYGINHYAW